MLWFVLLFVLMMSVNVRTLRACDASKTPILYINLPGEHAREEQLLQQVAPLKRAGHPCHRIEGVWGVDPRTKRPHADYRSDMSLSPQEYGAYRAHMNAVKWLAQSSHRAALILEDDAYMMPADDWPETLEQIIEGLPNGWTTCQLYYNGAPSGGGWSFHRRPQSFLRDSENRWGAVAYLLSKSGAVQIVDKAVVDVADRALYDFAGAQPYLYRPRLFTTLNEGLQSYIHPHHQKMHTHENDNVKREWKLFVRENGGVHQIWHGAHPRSVHERAQILRAECEKAGVPYRMWTLDDLGSLPETQAGNMSMQDEIVDKYGGVVVDLHY